MAASANPHKSTASARAIEIPRSRQLGDRVFALLCMAAALFVVGVSLALVAVLIWHAGPAIREIGLSFFTTVAWDPPHARFGALAFIFGTVATSAIAMLIAVPLGVGTAVFLSEIAPGWLRKIGSFLVEMLAAIPSVIYGFWGLLVLAPLMQWIFTTVGGPNQEGLGILSAGIILAIMVVPYVSSVTFNVCQAVPVSQRESSYALGATRWQTIWRSAPVRQARHFRRLLPCLGASPRRNHDGHDVDRKKGAGKLLGVCHGRFHSEHHRQRPGRRSERVAPVSARGIGPNAAFGERCRELRGATADLADGQAQHDGLVGFHFGVSESPGEPQRRCGASRCGTGAARLGRCCGA